LPSQPTSKYIVGGIVVIGGEVPIIGTGTHSIIQNSSRLHNSIGRESRYVQYTSARGPVAIERADGAGGDDSRMPSRKTIACEKGWVKREVLGTGRSNGVAMLARIERGALSHGLTEVVRVSSRGVETHAIARPYIRTRKNAETESTTYAWMLLSGNHGRGGVA